MSWVFGDLYLAVTDRDSAARRHIDPCFTGLHRWSQEKPATAASGKGIARLKQETRQVEAGGAGIRMRTTVRLGSVDAQNLAWDGEAYTNALYGHSLVNLDITLEGGIGKLQLLDQAQGIGKDAP